jgi:hypothetical protein
LNLGGNPIVGKGGHAGNVGRHLQVIADSEKFTSPVMCPIAVEDIKVFFQTNEDTPPDIAAA